MVVFICFGCSESTPQENYKSMTSEMIIATTQTRSRARAQVYDDAYDVYISARARDEAAYVAACARDEAANYWQYMATEGTYLQFMQSEDEDLDTTETEPQIETRTELQICRATFGVAREANTRAQNTFDEALAFAKANPTSNSVVVDTARIAYRRANDIFDDAIHIFESEIRYYSDGMF